MTDRISIIEPGDQEMTAPFNHGLVTGCGRLMKKVPFVLKKMKDAFLGNLSVTMWNIEMIRMVGNDFRSHLHRIGDIPVDV